MFRMQSLEFNLWLGPLGSIKGLGAMIKASDKKFGS